MKNDIWALSQVGGLDDADFDHLSPLLAAKVMMVDDEPLMTDLIQTYLEEEGYQNFVVSNDPRQALALIRREMPAVLLLDLMMPQVSGFELLEAIRADRSLRYTPVIVLTAASGADAKLRALQLGATDFLSKPVDASELVLRVRNTLAFHEYHNRLANYDAVTALPNQRLFDRGLEEMVVRRELVGGMVALVSIDIPEWKQLRESLDQPSADVLIKALARRLEKLAANEATASPLATPVERAPRVARLSADRFGLLFEGVEGGPAVELIAKRLMAEMAKPVTIGLHEIVPSAWIGIALAPGDGQTAETLRKSAEVAASQARQRGLARVEFASLELNESSFRRMTLGLQLRGAADRGELELHYQAKVRISDNCIIGAEALVRWNHPEQGLLQPNSFIALAEEVGLIGEIGRWVMAQACRDASTWGPSAAGALKIAVNVSKPQFRAGELCDTVRQSLAESGLPAAQLVIELTESMLMNDVAAGLELMQSLKRLGVTLSIDDFGTGYSSLAYIKKFPLNELKIDRSFVTDLPGAGTDVAIVRTIIELGRSLGMTVTAEGVETLEQLECLRHFGCDSYQGFVYSRPIPAAQFTRLLMADRNSRTGGGLLMAAVGSFNR